jgi:DNA repair protein RecN (Recombination protein N)
MLTEVTVNHLATVEHLTLELNSQLTVITGETGAGKSILLDALEFVLGYRSGSQLIRHDCNRLEVTAAFDIRTLPQILLWLKDNDLDSDEECLLRRIHHREGRSKAYLNGHPVPLQTQKTLGGLLMDIHGQHAPQSLLQAGTPRQLLDAFGDYDHLLSKVTHRYQQWKQCHQQLHTLKTAIAHDQAQRELLEFQLNELNTLEMQDNEWLELTELHTRLNHMDTLISSVQQLTQTLTTGDHSLLDQLNHVEQQLVNLSTHDSQLEGISQLLGQANIQVHEASGELRQYSDTLENDPEQLQHLEQRLELIHNIARKYRIAPEEIPNKQRVLQQQLDKQNNNEQEVSRLESQMIKSREGYLKSAQQLTQIRKTTATKLAQSVTRYLHDLAMPAGTFNVKLTPLGPIENGQFSAEGLESINFLVSTNPGQPAQPLSKVASGGELSRISLAILVATARVRHTPTLMFDEVDVGVGGAVAETVGRLLQTLAESRQIICITHLPQVASLGKHHLLVEKSLAKNSAHSTIRHLSFQERVEEISRMLGGVNITEQTRKHATEMIRSMQ